MNSSSHKSKIKQLKGAMGGILVAGLMVIGGLDSVSAQEKTRIVPVRPVAPTQQQNRIIPRRPPIVGPKLKVKIPEKVLLPDLVELKSGSFIMGAELSSTDDGPEHGVQVPGFEISKTPITNKQFRQFVETANYKTEAERTPTAYEKQHNTSWRTFATSDRDDYPVIWISYNDANAYCRWLTLVTKPRKTKVDVIDEEEDEKTTTQSDGGSITAEVIESFRLPTEAEWEIAARGDLDRMPYPWGESMEKEKLNCNWDKHREDSVDDAKKYLKPVGHQPANGFGLQDMAGNVGQWCYDFYNAGFYAKSPPYSPYGPDEGAERVVRGGSWFDSPAACKVSSRQHLKPEERNARTSFRIARSARAQIIIIEEDDE